MEENDQLEPLFTIGLDDHSRHNMRTIVLWALITGITGFISLLLLCISNIQTLNALAKIRSDLPSSTYFIWYLIATILFTVLCFLINYSLLRFSKRTKNGIEREDGEVVAAGIKHLNSYVKFLGVSTIIVIMLVLYLFLLGMMR